MVDISFEILSELTSLPGLPGREHQVASYIQNCLPKGKWQLHKDGLGNLIAHFPGEGKRIMIMAHMDEVGLIINRITPDGYLRVERMGGMGIDALPGSRLDLWTSQGCFPAQVGVLPYHLNNQASVEKNSIYVDIGCQSQAEVVGMEVQVGDGLTWASALQKLPNNRVSGKALDDRLGCLVLITLAQELIHHPPACDLILAFVVQEETMLMGGLPVVHAWQPEIVIGVDGTLTFDTPDLNNQQCELMLGRGPALKLMDVLRGKQISYVPDRELVQKIRLVAHNQSIPLQNEVVVGLSTALNPIPYANHGIPTAALSLPIRYHHSPNEMADLIDAGYLVQLLAALLRQEL